MNDTRRSLCSAQLHAALDRYIEATDGEPNSEPDHDAWDAFGDETCDILFAVLDAEKGAPK